MDSLAVAAAKILVIQARAVVNPASVVLLVVDRQYILQLVRSCFNGNSKVFFHPEEEIANILTQFQEHDEGVRLDNLS